MYIYLHTYMYRYSYMYINIHTWLQSRTQKRRFEKTIFIKTAFFRPILEVAL
jgi:hypothetical protein